MTGRDHPPALHEKSPEVHPEDLAAAQEYGLEVGAAPEPGPAVEVRELLRQLYGEPQSCGSPNPYLARYSRFRAKSRPKVGTSLDDPGGGIEYRCWPDLKLGYIESIHVGPETRRRGLGVRLVRFAIEHLRRRGSRSIYAFTVNPEGFRLLTSAGFAAGPAEDPSSPWRCWVSIE